MSSKKQIQLCYDAAYHDSATKAAIRELIIPSLAKRADELEACRKECSGNDEWRYTWAEAGFLEEEDQIKRAIEHAESVLAELDREKAA